MSNPNLSNIAEQLSSAALPSSNKLNGYNFDPHFRGKVREIRGMGYTPITAVLEFTDNSIRRKCGSKRVVVKLHRTFDPPYYLDRISVLDDGCGMTYQELCNSFIFNMVKEREDGDIGKFHVGGKYAAIALGDELMIISKREGGDVVGLYADIRQMETRNSFAPTDVCMNVDDEWALRKIPPTLWEQFKANPSGTLIHIPTLVANVRTNFSRYLEEFKRCLSTSYTTLYNGCKVVLEDQEKVIQEIEPIDLFYMNNPECLDESPYETELYIYNAGLGVPNIVIEKNTTSRTLPNKKLRCGTPARPQYFQYKAPEKVKEGKKGKGRPAVMFPIDASAVPDSKDLIDVQKVRIIQVNDFNYKKEKAYFPDNSRLAGDRKGFYFNREIRNVGAAKQLNKKMGDRTSMAAERQRCLITFSDKSDEQVGSKFNKQMDDNALPCVPLDAALKELYKQVTGPWVKKWTTREKAAKLAEAKEESEDELEEVEDDDVLNFDDEDQEEQQVETNTTTNILDMLSAIRERTIIPPLQVQEASETEEESVESEKEQEVVQETQPVVPTLPTSSDSTPQQTPASSRSESPVPQQPPPRSCPLAFDASSNSILFHSVVDDDVVIQPPGNARLLYDWLKSMPNSTLTDEFMNSLNALF